MDILNFLSIIIGRKFNHFVNLLAMQHTFPLNSRLKRLLLSAGLFHQKVFMTVYAIQALF